MKIGIIVSQFNLFITDKLLAGAERGLKEQGVEYEVVKVPGAFEIPLIAAKMARSKQYDALITLGVIIEGKTEHYMMVCRACTDGIKEVMLKYEIPIAFEVLMVRKTEHALTRAGDREDNNKGYTAAMVAVEMAGLMKS
ncbi:MAG: 6,7-dimethyl-8-ribityllumazine synthase [uncultured bacterium]|nr:MAG: 6,7-dimethyl-8-ribityllumazine synthase [uncultured bacterium]KKT76684.1 MAG: 6,7-dimethyl-8-ribityllumazine synthase [Candidatus Peregrinibacteria bacterium GW2011_GWA2_44_7]